MNNSTPWDISLETRKKEILDAKRNGQKLAIMLYSTEDLASSFRYRAYNVYQATKNSKYWRLVYFFTTEIDAVAGLIPDANLLVFGRITKWSVQLDKLALSAQQNNVKVLLDLDDCVCGQSHIKEMFNVVSPDVIDQNYWINTSANIELISNLADGFIVTNDYLGSILSETYRQKPYKVIRNFLNLEQLDFSAALTPKNRTGKEYIIGYFSGSHTHLTDFEVVYPELLQLLNDHKDIKLRIVGLLNLPSSANQYIKNGQIEFIPMTDFLSLQKLISEVDLNIAPLANNVFANCKSELKFFEAALVKTPTIASPTFAFKKAIKNGVTGYLCCPGEWYNTILELYKDPKLSLQITESAYAACLKQYHPKTCLTEIEKAYDYFTE